MPVRIIGKAQSEDPSPPGHPPSDALVWVVKQDTDDIQQAGEQLEGEVEQPDPQACGEGDIRVGAARSRPTRSAGVSQQLPPEGVLHGLPSRTCIPDAEDRCISTPSPARLLWSLRLGAEDFLRALPSREQI